MAVGKSSGGQRALPDLVSRIRVDSSSVDAAMMSLIHSFGKADLALAGLAAGIGLLVVGGKAMYDTWRKIDSAESGLTQAVAAHNSEIGTQTKKSAELGKAQKDLAAAKRQLYEYDLAHQAIAPKTSQDLRGHEADLKRAQAASKQLASAQYELEQFDLSHTGHVLTAAQLRQREHALQNVRAAQSNLSKSSRDAATIDTVTTRGQALSALELARRQDLLDKVSEAQGNVNDETAAGGRGASNQRLTLEQVRASADRLISTNRRYISDQSQVYDGYAKLIRGGLDLKETQRVINDAVDLSAIKHISLSEAVDILSNAEHGRMRGLIDLGITTKELTDADGNLLGGQRAIAAAMAEVDKKVAGGRDTISEVDQKTNELNNSWAKLSREGGPMIQTALLAVSNAASGVLDAFIALGENNGFWGAISDRLSAIARWIQDWIIIPLQKLNNLGLDPNDPRATRVFLTSEQEAQNRAAAARTSGFGKGGRAAGGPVLPGGTYRVGEDDEELLVMNARGGGYVYPTGSGGRRSGGTINITVNAQTNASPKDIATEISWELRKLRRAW